MSHHAAEIEVRHPRTTSGTTPSTFQERGVLVPFTTPLLGGARLRSGDRDLPELIVANPTGGRGVYVVPWAGIADICTPTLHDRMLYDRLRTAPVLHPASVRRVALDVARQGFAGREAAAAASAAQARQAGLVAATQLELLRMLVQQTMPAAARPDAAAELEAVGRRTLAAVAARLGRGADAVAAKLESLASVLAPLGVGVGVGGGAGDGRIPALLQALYNLQTDIRTALETLPPATGADAALVQQAAEQTGAAVRTLLAELVAPMDDVAGLLRSWVREPEALLARAMRPDWLLDGWDRICLLWQDEEHRAERLFAELADLVPATPREAGDWVPHLAETPAGIMRARRGLAGMTEDWRLGPLVADRIARNERLQARMVRAAW